jgi:hypothetical protein
VVNVTCFFVVKLGYAIIAVLSKPLKGEMVLGRDPLQSHQRSAQATLVALTEFKRYLAGLEKDLSRTSKKYSNREVAQGVGFVAAGIHEALNYLEIVKKVIVKTERVVAKKNSVSENARLSASD